MTTRPVAVALEGRWLTPGFAIVLAALAHCLPFLGFLVSTLLPVVTHLRRRDLWPSTGRPTSLVCSTLAWVGLWLPGLLSLFTPVSSKVGIEISTTWLIVPLCAPDRPHAVFLPALVATGVCALGLAAAVVHGRPWAWLAAAWLAPWAHQAAMSLIPHEYGC